MVDLAKMKKKYYVLVIDDDNGVRGAIADFLKENHFYVVEAADAERALQMARNQNFNLIICDINLPRMKGNDLVAEIRKLPNQAKTPIFVISGELNPDVIKSVKDTVQRIMVKPLVMADLVKEIIKVSKKAA